MPLLVGVGVLAGVVSTVASLASVVSYPALLAIGLPPLTANVTNTVALVFTGLGSAVGSRPELTGQRGRVLRLCRLTAVGGAGGAALLLLTPAAAFAAVAPVLIGVASVVLLVQPARRRGSRVGAHVGGGSARLAVVAVAMYVGYFGTAGGILMLAVLASMLDEPMVRINAVKNVISTAANGVAAIAFALFGPVRWAAAAPLALGFLVGGWLGPAAVRRLPGSSLRVVVGICGLAVAVKLGLDLRR